MTGSRNAGPCQLFSRDRDNEMLNYYLKPEDVYVNENPIVQDRLHRPELGNLEDTCSDSERQRLTR
jgi:hypothetical protein